MQIKCAEWSWMIERKEINVGYNFKLKYNKIKIKLKYMNT